MPRFRFANLRSSLVRVYKEYPFEAFFALAACLLELVWINFKANPALSGRIFNELLLACNLAFLILLFSSLALSRGLPGKFTLTARTIALILSVACWYFLHSADTELLGNLRFAFISVTLHLAVSFARYLPRRFTEIWNFGPEPEFWEFNKTLFLRFLSAMLYSGVLFGGLSLALLALHYLFSWEIESEAYTSLLALIFLLFSPLYFLLGVPRAGDETQRNPYPKVLRYFTQYVLIPLVGVYLLILFAYELKIAIQFTLPKGWVSIMILCYGLFGMLALLLVFPIRSDENQPWIKTFSKFFYWTLIPLTLLLMLAIYRRIHDYGFTESRFMVLVLAVWLGAMSVRFLFRPDAGIRQVPMSLCFCGLFCVFSPWNAFNTSMRSQLHKFIKYANDHSRSGSAKEGSLGDDNYVGAESTFTFLYNRHLYKPFQALVHVNLESTYRKALVVPSGEARPASRNFADDFRAREDIQKAIFHALHIAPQAGNMNYSERYSFVAARNALFDVAGYDYYYKGAGFPLPLHGDSIYLDGKKIHLNTSVKGNNVWLMVGQDSLLLDLSALSRLVKSQKKGPNGQVELDASRLAFSATGKAWDSKIQFMSVSVPEKSDTLDVQSYDWYLLLKKK